MLKRLSISLIKGELRPDALHILRKHIKPNGTGIGSADHFSTLRTKISDIEVLKDTLQALELPFKVDDDVRGGISGSGYSVIKADIVVVLQGSYDIGYLRNNTGSYDLVADLWGVAKAYNQTSLVGTISAVYTVKKSKKELQEIS